MRHIGPSTLDSLVDYNDIYIIIFYFLFSLFYSIFLSAIFLTVVIKKSLHIKCAVLPFYLQNVLMSLK